MVLDNSCHCGLCKVKCFCFEMFENIFEEFDDVAALLNHCNQDIHRGKTDMML